MKTFLTSVFLMIAFAVNAQFQISIVNPSDRQTKSSITFGNGVNLNQQQSRNISDFRFGISKPGRYKQNFLFRNVLPGLGNDTTYTNIFLRDFNPVDTFEIWQTNPNIDSVFGRNSSFGTIRFDFDDTTGLNRNFKYEFSFVLTRTMNYSVGNRIITDADTVKQLLNYNGVNGNLTQVINLSTQPYRYYRGILGSISRPYSVSIYNVRSSDIRLFLIVTKTALTTLPNQTNDCFYQFENGVVKLSKPNFFNVYSLDGRSIKSGYGSEFTINDLEKSVYLVKFANKSKVVRN